MYQSNHRHLNAENMGVGSDGVMDPRGGGSPREWTPMRLTATSGWRMLHQPVRSIDGEDDEIGLLSQAIFEALRSSSCGSPKTGHRWTDLSGMVANSNDVTHVQQPTALSCPCGGSPVHHNSAQAALDTGLREFGWYWFLEYSISLLLVGGSRSGYW